MSNVLRRSRVKPYETVMTGEPKFRSRREEYSEATRQALLAAGQAIFTAVGFQAAGLEAISLAARVTRGAFYHHFEDKKALFDALLVDLQAKAASQVRAKAAAGKTPWDRLTLGLGAFLEASIDPAYRRLAIQEAPAALGPARCREIAEAYPFGLLIGALQAMKDTGEMDIEDPRLAGWMIGSMVCEAALLLEVAEDQEAMKRKALALVERTLAGFRI